MAKLFKIKSSAEETMTSQAETHGRPARHLRILVADDDDLLRELVATFLMRSGYLVDMAEDGDKAWRSLCDKGYDLLITDNQMPKLTGFELIMRARAEAILLPVILASGTLPTEELSRNPAVQIDRMLLKPYSLEQLLVTIGELVPKDAEPGE